MDDKATCGSCHKSMDAALLDAVMRDEDGNDASPEAYCKTCWPRFRRVPKDQWRPLRAYAAKEEER